MSEDERKRWDQRYASGDYRPRTRATPFLVAWTPAFKPGKALVIACGTGRNAIHLADLGFDVTGVDISAVAIDRASMEATSRGLEIDLVAADLESFAIEPSSFDLITVIRYRNTRLWPKLVAGLTPNGWILAEHHMKTSLDVAGPNSPDFRLDPAELLEAFDGLRVVHYSESIEPADDESATFAIERGIACNGDPGW